MKKLFTSTWLIVFTLHCCPLHLLAQDNDDEEIFELSPFTVEASSNSGYRSTSTLAGTRLRTELKDVGSAISVINPGLFRDSGASIVDIEEASSGAFARASGIIVRFAFGYYAEEEKDRRPQLVEYLEMAETAASINEQIYFTPGALKISEGERKKMRGKKKSYFTSYAHFSLSFALHDGISPWKQVAAARQLMANLKFDSEVAKLYYGEALLLTESPFSTSAYNAPIAPLIRSVEATTDLGASIPYVINANGSPLRESVPLNAVTLIKRADQVKIAFAFDTLSPLESERIHTLNAALESIRSLVERQPSFDFSQGSLLLRHGDADEANAQPITAFASQAQFWITFALAEGADALASVSEARQLVQSAPLPEGISKVHYGSASLVLTDSQRYRDELMVAVFNEFQKIQDNLGERYELIPELQHKRVQKRRHSLTEVEVWIPYDYRIESVAERERQEKAMMLEHERALSASQAAARHCPHCDCSKSNERS